VKNCYCVDGYGYASKGEDCKSCTAKVGVASCSGIVPQIAAGFFRSESDPSVAFICSPADSCLRSLNTSTACATGYTGEKCGDCEILPIVLGVSGLSGSVRAVREWPGNGRVS